MFQYWKELGNLWRRTFACCWSPSPDKGDLKLEKKEIKISYTRFTDEQVPRYTTKQQCLTYLTGQPFEYQLASELGSGAFATTYAFTRSNSTEGEAVKFYAFGRKWQQGRSLNRATFNNEVEILTEQTLSHPNVVAFKEYFELYWLEDKQEYYVETRVPKPLCSPAHSHPLMGGVVLELLQDTLKGEMAWRDIQKLNESLIHDVFHDIGAALVYLHRTHHIVHNDVKLDNIAIGGVKEDGSLLWKLLDLGNAGKETLAVYMEAERHANTLNLDFENGFFELLPGRRRVLLDKNPFLEEARRLATMLIFHSAIGLDQLATSSTNLTVQIATTIFKEQVTMSDSRLKHVLLGMAQQDIDKQITVNRALKYLKSQ